MKKMFVMALMATMMVSCDKCELEEAEANLIEMREKEDQKKNEKTQAQKTEFMLFNSKIIGAKGEGPQGKQSDYSPNKDKNKESHD